MQLTEFDAHRHSIATRSGEISYIDVGPASPERTGPVALFVHGIATTAGLWRNVIGALAGPRPDHRRLIAPDLPLHGHSPVTADQDLSVAALAEGLEDFCDALADDGPTEASFSGERLGDDVLYTHAWIQRAIRVLEYCLHSAAIAGQVLFSKGAHLLVSKEQRARSRFGQ